MIGAGLLAAAGPAAASVDFARAVNIPSNGGAAWLTAGDLNGDAIVDLVVATAANTVVIHRGLGGGQFSAGSAVPVGSQPYGAILADFNGDAKLDIATANNGDRTVSILLGNGAGGIVSSSQVPVGVGPVSISAGDVNGDGKADLVVMNLESRNASLLLGNGDGTFAASFLAVGPAGFDSAVGDVTGDGIVDLVVAATDGVRVLPGPPNPAFAPPFQLAGTTVPFRLGLGDFNRDGRLDVAAANVVSYDVSVALGLGGNAFTQPRLHPVSALPSSMAVADVNGDSILDIATTNTLSNDVSVLEGAGTGGFRPAKQFRVGRGPQGIHAADVNGDGRADLLVSNTPGTVSVLIARPLVGKTGTAKVRERCLTPRRVVAGTSIGCVGLGMSRAQVVELLGKPVRIRRNAKTGEYLYVYRSRSVNFSATNSVSLEWTTRRGDGLANGLKVGSPGTLVKKRFPKATCRTRNGVKFCTANLNADQLTGFVVAGGVVVEIDVGLR